MARSGQVTVTTAGTAVAGTSQPGHLFAIKAHPDNTEAVWIGNDGANDVTSSNGYPLEPGEQIIIEITNLSELYFDADVNGEIACWVAMD